MTRIYLIRHGAVYNPKRLVYGTLPGFHLSRTGRLQSTRLGDKLSGEGIQIIYSSDVERAVETAHLIASKLPGQGEFAERSKLGEDGASLIWQGTPICLVPIRFPKQYLSRVHHPERIRFAENAVQMAERIQEVLDEILSKHPNQTVVVISHATPIAAWMIWHKHLPWRRLHLTSIGNLCGYVIEADGRHITRVKSFRLSKLR